MKSITERRNKDSFVGYKQIVNSLIILNIYIWVSNLEATYGIPHFVKYLLGLYVIWSIISYYMKNKINIQVSGFIWLTLLFFIIRSILLLIGSFRTDIFYLQEIFGGRDYFMPFLLPLILLFTRYDILFFKGLLRYTYILLFFAVGMEFYTLIFKPEIESWGAQYSTITLFELAAPLLLFVSHLYKKKSVQNLSILYFAVFIFLYALWGRRGAVLITLVIFLLFIIIRNRSNSVHINKKILIVLYVGIIGFVLISFSDLYIHKLYVFERGINKEGWDSSRGSVVDEFFQDFKGPKDWIIGRGLNGRVLRSISETGTGRGNEIGYLNILLKGGLLYLIPMILLFLQSSYLGFFKTNNDLTKALAAVILIQIFAMFSFGMAEFSPQYILVWIAVAACFNRSLRSISNKDLILFLNKA